MPFDAQKLRGDFPILSREILPGVPLVYLDSAASAQKPQAVIDAMVHAMTHSYANVHHGVHALGIEATELFEAARAKAARFIGAEQPAEIVFVRGATEGINLVAQAWGRKNLSAGDEVVITEIEHHANLVPWQMLAEEKGVILRAARVRDNGALDMSAFESLMTKRTKLVAVSAMSNVLGIVNPVEDIVNIAHARGIPVLVDACQFSAHLPTDVRRMGCDFLVFSGHKLYGPTGIGVLYGRQDMLESMPPWQGGGHMIDRVSLERTTFAEAPMRFEAGTPAIVEAIGLGAAIDYVSGIGMDKIAAHEQALHDEARRRLAAIPGVRMLGGAPGTTGIVSFVIEGAQAYDIAVIADRMGVALRAGHHCAQTTMARFGVAATVRASFGLYNTMADIEALEGAVRKARSMLT